MLKTLALFLSFFPLLVYSQVQKILLQDYSFLVMDGEINKLRQSNDTLYEYHCNINRPCLQEPEKHYKIIDFKRANEFTILKLEQLDTIPLTIDPYPDTRYLILGLKTDNNNELGYLPLMRGLTKPQLDTVQINVNILKEKFFFTYFSDSYLRELSVLKRITTKEEAKEIIEFAKGDRFKKLIEKYSKTEIGDMYASGLVAEIFNRACIERGYSPIGAGRSINTLMRK